MKLYLVLALLGLCGLTAIAQDCAVGPNGTHNFFNACSGGTSPLTISGNYYIQIKQGTKLVINGSVTVNGTLTINFDGNFAEMEIPSGSSLKATNVVIINSNPEKVLDINGTFTIEENIDFNGENIELDGTGTITAGSITEAENVDCSATSTCPNVSAESCSPPNQGLCADAGFTQPVTLKHFKASASLDNIVELEWITLSEKGFDKFVVHHSTDGVHFKLLDEVSGAMTDLDNIETRYFLLDKAPVLGLNYYQLEAKDLDGRSEYFKIVSITIGGGKHISVSPNPNRANGAIRFRSNFPAEETDFISIINEIGTELIRLPASVAGNELTLPWALTPGVYILKYTGRDTHFFERLIITE